MLTVLLIIQTYSEGCTITCNGGCYYHCIKECDHRDCLGPKCEGSVGCFDPISGCPPGSFAAQFFQNSSMYYI